MDFGGTLHDVVVKPLVVVFIAKVSTAAQEAILYRFIRSASARCSQRSSFLNPST